MACAAVRFGLFHVDFISVGMKSFFAAVKVSIKNSAMEYLVTRPILELERGKAMSYEKEIPDYAMMPAKELKEIKESKIKKDINANANMSVNAQEEAADTFIIPVTKGALYSSVQVTDISEKPKTTIIVEEDILVPDTKPDMREILLIDGKAKLSSREFCAGTKADEYITLSGEVELTALYLPEKAEACGEVISVQSRIPFKEQWHIGIAAGACLVVKCRTEKIEYMVVNERKYRVKLTLAVFAKEYADKKIEIFEGISGEEIQMCKEKIELTRVDSRKKDSLSISENLSIRSESRIENILKQDICVIENYKQVTGEKVVINGFITVNLLYTVAGECESECGNIRQASEKVEFTQFIPVHQNGEASGCGICFDSSDLRVKAVQDDEEGEVLRLEGELLTYIEIYTNEEKEIITDAYHREKDFVCDFKEEKSRTMVGSSIGETSIREIISPENYGEIECVLYTGGDSVACESYAENGKIVTEGIIAAKLICRSEAEGEGEQAHRHIFSIRKDVPFRVSSAMPQAEGGEIVDVSVCMKDFHAEKINGKQIELNATVSVSADVMRDTPFRLPQNPAFEECAKKSEKARMVVYISQEGDSLWSIAKRFKSTPEAIRSVNQKESDEIAKGEKLLILG